SRTSGLSEAKATIHDLKKSLKYREKDIERLTASLNGVYSDLSTTRAELQWWREEVGPQGNYTPPASLVPIPVETLKRERERSTEGDESSLLDMHALDETLSGAPLSPTSSVSRHHSRHTSRHGSRPHSRHRSTRERGKVEAMLEREKERADTAERELAELKESLAEFTALEEERERERERAAAREAEASALRERKAAMERQRAQEAGIYAMHPTKPEPVPLDSSSSSVEQAGSQALTAFAALKLDLAGIPGIRSAGSGAAGAMDSQRALEKERERDVPALHHKRTEKPGLYMKERESSYVVPGTPEGQKTERPDIGDSLAAASRLAGMSSLTVDDTVDGDTGMEPSTESERVYNIASLGSSHAHSMLGQTQTGALSLGLPAHRGVERERDPVPEVADPLAGSVALRREVDRLEAKNRLSEDRVTRTEHALAEMQTVLEQLAKELQTQREREKEREREAQAAKRAERAERERERESDTSPTTLNVVDIRMSNSSMRRSIGRSRDACRDADTDYPPAPRGQRDMETTPSRPPRSRHRHTEPRVPTLDVGTSPHAAVVPHSALEEALAAAAAIQDGAEERDGTYRGQIEDRRLELSVASSTIEALIPQLQAGTLSSSVGGGRPHRTPHSLC
ncbi:hypothetical protein KIPB_003533, partial [Kipferlia bialata]